VAWKSSAKRYGGVAIFIHWVTAVVILALLVAGIIAATTADDATKSAILRIHAPLGISIAVLTLFRIVWWTSFDRKPPPPSDSGSVQRIGEKAVHGLFYVAILVMGASGIGLMVLSGAGEILFGSKPGPLPDFAKFPPFYGHLIGALLLIALLVGHVGAALWHQLFKRDQLLSRMGVGRATSPDDAVCMATGRRR
jgi:cytochrome b561